MLSSEPLEIVEATSEAMRAARESRGAILQVAEQARRETSETVRLDQVELPVSVLRAIVRMLDELSEGNPVALHAVV